MKSGPQAPFRSKTRPLNWAGDEVWEGGDLSVGKVDRIVIGRLVCGVELLDSLTISRTLAKAAPVLLRLTNSGRDPPFRVA